MKTPFIQLDSSDASTSWNHPARPVARTLTCDCGTGVARLQAPDGTLQRSWPSPIEALTWLGSTDAREHDWIGFLSYDLGRYFENLPVGARDDLNLPLFVLTAYDSRAESKCSEHAAAAPQTNAFKSQTGVKSTFTQQQYESAVRQAIDYIAAGDVFQVNLSQRFSLPMTDTPQAIYRRLREQSPAAFGGLLDFGDFALICNSPELFLKVTPDRRVITRPIKGTRPLGPGMKEQLLHSIKDQAELNMIVDLARNDLGRVCEVGSVRVTEPRSIESHPTVYHGVATIEGTLREKITFLDLLRATFPGGSITGAPKIRAMEIIEQLEPVRRGPYCGAIGYIGRDGTIELNIAIRTMIAKDGIIHIPVGGGIVADSSPRDEYEETLVKAKAMFAAVGVPLQAVEPLGKK